MLNDLKKSDDFQAWKNRFIPMPTSFEPGPLPVEMKNKYECEMMAYCTNFINLDQFQNYTSEITNREVYTRVLISLKYLL